MLRYPGGKTKHQKRFLKYIPQKMKEARFPFVGGGGIFWIINLQVERWINDINHNLMSVYMALRDRPDEFVKMCSGIDQNKLKETFEHFKKDESIDPALRYFFINRVVWAGRVNYKKGMESRLYFSNPEGWNIVKTNKLQKAADIVKNTKITSVDYSELLKEPGKDVWLYLDPPYVSNTYMSKTDQQYEDNFTLEDHLRFVDNIKKCQHRWCISYDDTDEIREWFSDFYIHDEEWKYSGSSMSEKKNGKELVITNYKTET
jgi:DNA adenine methylase